MCPWNKRDPRFPRGLMTGCFTKGWRAKRRPKLGQVIRRERPRSEPRAQSVPSRRSPNPSALSLPPSPLRSLSLSLSEEADWKLGVLKMERGGKKLARGWEGGKTGMKARRGKGFFDFFFAYLVLFLSHDHPRPSTPPVFSSSFFAALSVPPSLGGHYTKIESLSLSFTSAASK